MIEINLLPKELQRKKIEFPDISFLPIVAGVVGIIVVLHLLLSLSVNLKARTLRRLEKRWEEILPAKADADRVINELTTMRGRMNAIDRLIQGRINWARKLSDLSDAMIPGVWLNRLWIEKKAVYKQVEKTRKAEGGEAQVNAEPKKVTIETLHINGSVIATGGEETAIVGKFMWSLESNPGFFADFSEMESAYMQHNKLKDVEVMDFELICYFKEK